LFKLAIISPRIPIIAKTMVVVTNCWSMQKEKLQMVYFSRKCNFTRGSNVGMVCGCGKFNFLVIISFVIFYFGLRKEIFQP
jgi:hypothetical protein